MKIITEFLDTLYENRVIFIVIAIITGLLFTCSITRDYSAWVSMNKYDQCVLKTKNVEMCWNRYINN